MLLAMALASVVFSARAQSVPKPKEFYFDVDRAAVPVVAITGAEGDALVDQLVKARERGRKTVEATTQLAHIAANDGRKDLSLQLYQQALGSAQSGGSLWRSISWNYGWDLFRLGEHQAALQQWSPLIGAVGGASWVPPTFALALWKLDRKDEAVQWFGAAVRTEPLLWTDARNHAGLLPGWRQEDRDTLAEVLGAWQANPPVWP
ncbi:tetratricopeptide repeat protein [Pseudoxanthomonas mexicana]|uniref:tetratricopeptide repeat protein n=1 Tax=Pseudoxanthomonas TaxID=83618 RepID=UPI000785104B